MSGDRCEICGFNPDDYGVKVKLIRARGGRIILCNGCWKCVRHMPDGFVSPNPVIRDVAERYHRYAKQT